MEDIKQRLLSINKIVNGYSPLGSEGQDGEVVCLLLRKVLEQLAFASLIAHKSTYSAVYSDFARTWRAKRLLDRLAVVHPDYYPKPVAFPSVDTSSVKNMLEVKEGFLTQNEFVFLYDNCSEVLHTWNPFRVGPRVVSFDRPILEWVQRIQRLLDVHWVHLSGESDLWLIQMHQPEDGKVHAYLATAV
ncbi:MAG: hypothetical protein WCD07_07865 [Burkholderiales bacterium]